MFCTVAHTRSHQPTADRSDMALMVAAALVVGWLVGQSRQNWRYSTATHARQGTSMAWQRRRFQQVSNTASSASTQSVIQPHVRDRQIDSIARVLFLFAPLLLNIAFKRDSDCVNAHYIFQSSLGKPVRRPTNNPSMPDGVSVSTKLQQLLFVLGSNIKFACTVKRNFKYSLQRIIQLPDSFE